MPLQQIFLQGKLSIHERYYQLINHLKFQSPVLKTDLWNELKTKWPIKANTYIEIDPKFVDDAKNRGYHAFNGNIERMNFKSNSFNTIIDLSTIDHIKEPLSALKEYNRILKRNKNSNCYIICWLGILEPQKMGNWNGMQYFFNKDEFIAKVYKSGFKIISYESFKGIGNPNQRLVFFHLKKDKYLLKLLFKNTSIFEVIYNRRLYYKMLDGKKIIKQKNSIKIPIRKFNIDSFCNIQIIKMDPSKNEFKFLALNEDAQIILSVLPKKHSNLMVQLDITSPIITNIQIFYKLKEDDSFCEKNSVVEQTSPGRNKIQLYVLENKLFGQLRLDPCNIKGEYTIHNVELIEWGI